MSGQEPTRRRSNAFARQWKADETPAPHPAPEVPMREATENEIGRSARAMRKLAAEHGWAVRVTYSRGTTMTATGKPGKVVDSIVVRMHAANRGAWGAWHDGKFDSAQTWERERDRGPRPANATELKAFIANGVISEWP